MSLCFVTYFVIRPDAHGGGTFGELPGSGDFWGAASSFVLSTVKQGWPVCTLVLSWGLKELTHLFLGA